MNSILEPIIGPPRNIPPMFFKARGGGNEEELLLPELDKAGLTVVVMAF